MSFNITARRGCTTFWGLSVVQRRRAQRWAVLDGIDGLKMVGDEFCEVFDLDSVRDGLREGLETERTGGDYGLRVVCQ